MGLFHDYLLVIFTPVLVFQSLGSGGNDGEKNKRLSLFCSSFVTELHKQGDAFLWSSS